MKTYTKITETNGHEGEDWTTFLVEQGNEEFISKLEKVIAKFPELEGTDSFIEIEENEIPEFEVDIVVKHTRSGYSEDFSKCDKIIDPQVIDDSDSDNFVDSYYKQSYF